MPGFVVDDSLIRDVVRRAGGGDRSGSAAGSLALIHASCLLRGDPTAHEAYQANRLVRIRVARASAHHRSQLSVLAACDVEEILLPFVKMEPIRLNPRFCGPRLQSVVDFMNLDSDGAHSVSGTPASTTTAVNRTRPGSIRAHGGNLAQLVAYIAGAMNQHMTSRANIPVWTNLMAFRFPTDFSPPARRYRPPASSPSPRTAPRSARRPGCRRSGPRR